MRSILFALLVSTAPFFSACEYQTSLGPNCELDCNACKTCSDSGMLCGNGVLDPGEDCDTTPSPGSDSCDLECRNAACGNGALEPGEMCEVVVFEERGSCDTSCMQVGPIGCGNGAIEQGEECDDGNLASGDGCDADCQWQNQSSPVCGDSAVQPGEECDDGNTLASDGCAADCQIESGWNCSYERTQSVCRML